MNSKIEESLGTLADHLKQRDFDCNKRKEHGPRAVKPEERVYFRDMMAEITLYRLTSILSFQCEEADKYMKCLNDTQTKDLLKELLLFKKELAPLLRTLYSINDQEAESMILFLDSFETTNCTSLQRNSCGM